MRIDEGRRFPFAGPPGLTGEVVVSILTVGLVFGVRYLIEMVATGVAPFALVYPGVAAAALLAGWRSGLAVLLICQILNWYFFLPFTNSWRIATLGDGISLILTTFSGLILLWMTSKYAEQQRGLLASEAARADDLQLALQELDHRTMNNFQIAATVLQTQKGRDASPELTAALAAAGQKLLVLAAAHRKLTMGRTDVTKRPLETLIEEVLEGLRGYLEDSKVQIVSQLAEIDVSHEFATRVALIVNELVTNAVKHAFPQGKGIITVKLQATSDAIVLTVADDGVGRPAAATSGSGSRLTTLLAHALGGELAYLAGQGTAVMVTVPYEFREPVAPHRPQEASAGKSAMAWRGRERSPS